jgi:hypothetical protein
MFNAYVLFQAGSEPAKSYSLGQSRVDYNPSHPRRTRCTKVRMMFQYFMRGIIFLVGISLSLQSHRELYLHLYTQRNSCYNVCGADLEGARLLNGVMTQA